MSAAPSGSLPPLSEEERAIFANAIRQARMLQRTLGPLCEVAIHDFRDLEHSLISQIGAVRNGNRTRSSLIASMRIGLDGTRRLQTRTRLLGPNNLSTRVGTIVMHLTAQVPISLLKLAPQLDESRRNLGEALP